MLDGCHGFLGFLDINTARDFVASEILCNLPGLVQLMFDFLNCPACGCMVFFDDVNGCTRFCQHLLDQFLVFAAPQERNKRAKDYQYGSQHSQEDEPPADRFALTFQHQGVVFALFLFQLCEPVFELLWIFDLLWINTRVCRDTGRRKGGRRNRPGARSDRRWGNLPACCRLRGIYV